MHRRQQHRHAEEHHGEQQVGDRLVAIEGIAATKQVAKPLKVCGYVGQKAHTARLLSTKNETDEVKLATTSFAGFAFSLNIALPSHATPA